MSGSLCRVSVQPSEIDGLYAVDLALPSDVHVDLLLPSIVDIVYADMTEAADVRRWHLSRIGGPDLDSSMTLTENDVRDGELLLLTTMALPAPEWAMVDPCRLVAAVANGVSADKVIGTAACLFAAATGAVALVWSGIVTRAVGHVVVGATLAAAGIGGAVMVRRTHLELSATLSVIAIVFTMTVGFLVVPAGPSAGNFFLASAAGFAMAILLLRVTGCGAMCLTAIAAFSATVATATGGGLVGTLSVEVIGAALAVLSLALLAVAARVSIAVADLTPPMPGEDHRSTTGIETRAALAHQTLSGLIIGSSASTALGSALVAATGEYGNTLPVSGAAFAAVVGLVLLLRARTHSDFHRRIALAAGGLLSVAAAFMLVVISSPAHAYWLSVVAAASGVGALGAGFGVTVSPIAHRAVDLLEYLALAAVVPLACWVGDLYGLIRDMSLA